MRWSVTVQAVGDRVLTREEVVELPESPRLGDTAHGSATAPPEHTTAA